MKDIDRFAELCGWDIENERYLTFSAPIMPKDFDPHTDANHALMLARATKEYLQKLYPDPVSIEMHDLSSGEYLVSIVEIYDIEIGKRIIAEKKADTFPLAICEAVKAALEAQ